MQCHRVQIKGNDVIKANTMEVTARSLVKKEDLICFINLYSSLTKICDNLHTKYNNLVCFTFGLKLSDYQIEKDY